MLLHARTMRERKSEREREREREKPANDETVFRIFHRAKREPAGRYRTRCTLGSIYISFSACYRSPPSTPECNFSLNSGSFRFPSLPCQPLLSRSLSLSKIPAEIHVFLVYAGVASGTGTREGKNGEKQRVLSFIRTENQRYIVFQATNSNPEDDVCFATSRWQPIISQRFFPKRVHFFLTPLQNTSTKIHHNSFHRRMCVIRT